MLKNARKSWTSKKNPQVRRSVTRTMAFETLQGRELMAADLELPDLGPVDVPVDVAPAELAGYQPCTSESGRNLSVSGDPTRWPSNDEPTYDHIKINGK
jgi:hypothetical protein